jgi:hypothetical protein
VADDDTRDTRDGPLLYFLVLCLKPKKVASDVSLVSPHATGSLMQAQGQLRPDRHLRQRGQLRQRRPPDLAKPTLWLS